MTPASLIMLGSVAACSVCGGAAFKQFAVTREPLWILAGVIAYNFSNVGWLALIDETGLARATALATSVQILGLTAVAAFTGERVALAGWLSAALVCLSIFVSSIQSTRNQPTGNAAETTGEAAADPSHPDFRTTNKRRLK